MTHAGFDVDVIIATHSPSRPVKRAVASVLDHTIAPVRVTVVIHNTDPEPVREALREYIADPRLRIVEFADGIPSPSGPMNHGLALATARYSSLLGSDDELSPGAIDRWLELTDTHSAGAVIARLDFTDGTVSPQPPVRPRYRAVRDPERDRLAYRSAPLGLVSTEHFGELRLTEGLASGEDIAYSLQIWFSKEPIVYAEQSSGYIVHVDGEDRVTVAKRPAAEALAYLPEILDADWFSKLTVREREAIAVKLLRVQLLSVAGSSAGADDSSGAITDADRTAFSDARRMLAAAAPLAGKRLSRSEYALLDAVTTTNDAKTVQRALAAWKRRFTPAGMLPRNPFGVLHRQAPLRYGIASILLGRRAGRA